MGKPKAPAPPDYAAAATEQGKANVNSAIATNFLNQADQTGPYGSLKYNYDYTNGLTLPDGTRIPRTAVETILSPDQQKLLDQNTNLSISLNDLAAQGLDYVGRTANTPVDRNGLPSLRSGLGTPQLAGAPGTTDFQSSYDFSGASKLPTMADFNGQRDQITDAYMQRLQPLLDRQRAAMENKLANQGITNGSEAWRFDQDALNRGENDQRIAALLAGDQLQQNMFGNAMAARQQGVNESMAQTGLFNEAANNRFSQDLTAAQFGNQTAQAGFNMGLAGGQFDNQARAQAIQEADYFRNQPLNMLNALRSGNQVNMPQFGNVSAGANIQAAPIYQATADSYSAALDKYKAEMQARGGLLGGLGTIGSAAIGKWG